MMRALQFVFLPVMLLTVFGGCKKDKATPTPKPTPKNCHGSFITVKPVSYDLRELTGIDENGFPIDLSEFPVMDRRSSSNICYNKKDSCVYILAADGKKYVYLYKFNLATRETEGFICTNPDAMDYVPYSWYLYYNDFTDEFFVGYCYLGDHWYVSDKFKLTITGKTFSAKYFSVPGIYDPHIVAPYFIDEHTGDMYFYDYTSRGSIRYSPISDDTTNISYSLSAYGSEYNPNDGKFYGYNSQKQLVRFDFKTGVSEAYGFLNTDIDSITGINFDVCNNQYVFYKSWDVLRIYWVDIANGKIVKEITTQGGYDPYDALILIPQRQ